MIEGEDNFVEVFTHSYKFLFPLTCMIRVADEKDISVLHDEQGNLTISGIIVQKHSLCELLHEKKEEERICCVLQIKHCVFLLSVHRIGDIISRHTLTILDLPYHAKTRSNQFIKCCGIEENQKIAYIIHESKLLQWMQERVCI